MGKNNNKEILNLAAIKRLVGTNYDCAYVYDITRKMEYFIEKKSETNDHITWKSMAFPNVYCKMAIQWKEYFYRFSKDNGDVFSDLEFVGPIALGNYVPLDGFMRGIAIRAIGVNLAVRNTHTGKLDLLNRDSWFVVCEDCYEYSLLMPFFYATNTDTEAGILNAHALLEQAMRSRTGR